MTQKEKPAPDHIGEVNDMVASAPALATPEAP